MLNPNSEYMNKLDCYFLKDLLLDEELLSWTPGNKAWDITKKVIEVYRTFKSNPEKITLSMIENIVTDKNSEIGKPEFYLNHIKNTSDIYSEMCNLLLEKDAFLDLPEPDEARARGLIHDLDSTYSDYKKTGQQSKQIDLYFHARHLGLPVISHEVAMHCAYLEVLEIISSREPFPNSGAYSSMADFLEKKQLMLKIIKEFADYKKGKDNLPLIALSVADYLSTDKAYNKIDLRDKNSFDEFFKERAEDIVSRYYYKPLQEQRPVSALGTALIVKKGYDRMLKNKEIISTLLYGTEDAIAQLEQKAPKL